jgi:hypothetical protein
MEDERPCRWNETTACAAPIRGRIRTDGMDGGRSAIQAAGDSWMNLFRRLANACSRMIALSVCPISYVPLRISSLRR